MGKEAPWSHTVKPAPREAPAADRFIIAEVRLKIRELTYHLKKAFFKKPEDKKSNTIKTTDEI